MSRFRPDPNYHRDLHVAAERIHEILDGRTSGRQAVSRSRRHIRPTDAADLGRLANSLGLAGETHRADTEIGHLTPGEIVVPLHAQTTSVLRALGAALGTSLSQYVVGSGLERRNPVSGKPAFASPLPEQYQWVGDPMGWVGEFGRQIADAATNAARAPGQAVGTLGDFLRNYVDMRHANIRDADKYFHCKANFDAARRGMSGAAVAESLSDAREWYGRNIKGDPAADSRADQIANRYGRSAAQSGRYASARTACEQFRPRGLPASY